MVFKNSKIKNLLLFCSFVIFSNGVFAQGNLQFNQVLTYSGTIGASGPGGVAGSLTPTSIYTVPTGKVWKIETKTIPTGPLKFYINGVEFKDYLIVTSGSGAVAVTSASNPIWLKAADFIYYTITSWPTGSAVSSDFFISIIEFNIAP